MSSSEQDREVEQPAEASNPFQSYLDLRDVPLQGQLAEDWDELVQPGTPG